MLTEGTLSLLRSEDVELVASQTREGIDFFSEIIPERGSELAFKPSKTDPIHKK